MMMGSGVEFIVWFFMMMGGSFGIPMGMPPAEPNPMMSRVAPAECVYYASWSAATTIDPDANPTEKWMGQEELQRSFLKAKSEIKKYLRNMAAEEGNPGLQAGIDFMIDFVETCVTHSGAIYISKFEIRGDDDTRIDVDFDLQGGLLLHLGEHAETIHAKFKRLLETAPADVQDQMGEVDIDGITYRSFPVEETNIELLWAVHEGYLRAGLSRESIRQMHANLKTESPAWLTDLNSRIPVDRVSTVSYLNTAALMPLLDLIDEPEFMGVVDATGIKNLKSLGWVSGLNPQGFVTRTAIDLTGEPEGIFAFITGEAIEPAEIGRVDKDALFVMSHRLSTQKIYDFVFEIAEQTGGRAELEEQIDQFERMTGVSIQDELVDSVDDLVTAYGSFNMLSPTSGWVLSVKVKNEMVFQGAYNKLNEFVKNMADEMGYEFKERERNGRTIVSLDGVTDFGLPVEPSWCWDEGEVIFSLNRSAISKHVRREGVDEETNIALQEPMKQLFAQAGAGRQGPLAVVQFDMAELVTLGVSALRGLLPDDEPLPGTDLTIQDLPTPEVLTNGVQPNVTGLYRTPTGFELYQQQTYPGGSPGATAALTVGLTLPAFQTTRVAARRADDANRLRQLAIAMHNYHDVHRGLPPAYSTDEDGNPLLSWRVLLLPYLEEAELYDEFHLDEPWDSDHNIALLEKMPELFKPVNTELAEVGTTTFLAATGEGAMFGPPDEDQNGIETPIGTHLARIRDGTSLSIMLVQANAGQAVKWTEPKDFDVEGGMFLGRLEGVFPSGTNFAFGDASIHMIQVAGKEELLEKLFSISGGEVVGYDELND